MLQLVDARVWVETTLRMDDKDYYVISIFF